MTMRQSFLQSAFMRIAEPRVIRVIQFFVYLAVTTGGVGLVIAPPPEFESVLGIVLTYVVSGFLLVGGVVGMFAVLPGIWWMERASVLLLITGLSMYAVVAVSMTLPIFRVALIVSILLAMVQRYVDIHGSQLAPREG